LEPAYYLQLGVLLAATPRGNSIEVRHYSSSCIRISGASDLYNLALIKRNPDKLVKQE
jgi:hypothetical protein